MKETAGRSPVHRIIETFSKAMSDLGLGVPPLFVERWGVAVHHCLAYRTRQFHTHEHVLDLVEGSDPLETLGALYHDAVYVQVDLGVPAHFAQLLEPLLAKEAAGFRILPHAAVDPVASDVLALFSRRPDEVLSVTTGLNELASALVAAKELEGVLSREQQLAVATCIEATIPFRDVHGEHLYPRLLGLGVDGEAAAEMVRRAVRLSNRDVGNFADADPGYFLDNTWKLLPETNPSLHIISAYSVHEYRVALWKMEAFLAQLPAERVFHAWGGEPGAAIHAGRVEAARRNIDLAVRYLRGKLYSTALLEALAVESGGDGPLDLFMGGLPEAGVPMRRIESFLPTLPVSPDVDEELRRLLHGGRATPSFFDVSPSSLAHFLYSALGEARVMAGVQQAQSWWAEQCSSRQFLAQQPRVAVEGLARAAMQVAPTRSGALGALLTLLPPAAPAA